MLFVVNYLLVEWKILRKRNIIIVSVIITSLLSSIPLSQGLYQGTIGDIYYFDILESSVELKLGNNDYSGNRFYVAGNPLVPPQTASCEIIDFPISLTKSVLIVGSYSQFLFNMWYTEDEYDFYSMIIYPMTNCESFLSNPALVADGFGLFFYPFADTEYTYNFFSELVTLTQSQLTEYTPNVNTPVFEAIGGKTGNLYTFESLFTGTIEDVHPPSYNLRFKIQFKCYFEYDLGVLYGLHYKVNLKGDYNGESASITGEFLVERTSYDLPAFSLGSFNIATDWWIIATAVGGGLLLIIIIVVAVTSGKKKKPKKKKSKSGKKKKK